MVKINPELYGADPTSYAESIGNRILGVPAPTLDINGEKDDRATSEGNAAAIAGRSNQGEPADIGRGGRPSPDGGT